MVRIWVTRGFVVRDRQIIVQVFAERLGVESGNGLWRLFVRYLAEGFCNFVAGIIEVGHVWTLHGGFEVGQRGHGWSRVWLWRLNRRRSIGRRYERLFGWSA